MDGDAGSEGGRRWLRGVSDLTMLTWARLSSAKARGFDVVSAHEPACREQLLAVLRRHSRYAGQFHALSRDDWQVLWTQGRRAFIPFHEKTFSLIAWRDPVASDERHALDALHLFRSYASTIGKHALVLAASERLRRASPSFASIWIGGEQRFDLERFTLRGRPGEKLRLAINHARRLGAHAREIHPRRDEDARRRLLALEEAWKRARPARRTRSFLRTEPLENAEHRRYFAVEMPSAEGPVMQSFVVCSPVSERGYYLQDLVRAPDAPRGAAELVTVAALEAFQREGLAMATAGLVPFHDPQRRRSEGIFSGAVAACIRHFDRMYRFRGLQQFRAKFAMAEVESSYVLHWPAALTPFAIWDVGALLSM